MSPEREVTTAELADDIKELSRSVRDLARILETTYVRKDVYDLAHRVLDAKVIAVEARQTLIARTAVTALLLPIVVAVVVALLLGAVV
jgi:hypothetical protein